MKVTDENIRKAIEKFLDKRETENGYLETYGHCYSWSYIYISRDWSIEEWDIDVFNERCIPEWLEVMEEIDIPDFEHIKSKYLEIIKLTEGED